MAQDTLIKKVVRKQVDVFTVSIQEDADSEPIIVEIVFQDGYFYQIDIPFNMGELTRVQIRIMGELAKLLDEIEKKLLAQEVKAAA